MQVCSARNLWQLVLPHLGLGLGVGAVDAALVPLLAYLVDTRHGAGYGAVYALQQTAVSLAYALGECRDCCKQKTTEKRLTLRLSLVAGPMLGGALMRVVGFPWLMRVLGALCLVCSPLLALLARLDLPDKLPQVREGRGAAREPRERQGAASLFVASDGQP